MPMRMRLTKRITRKIIVELALLYGVRLHFEKTKNQHGEARYWSNSISINLNQSGVSMLSTFFHEIGHVYCFQKGIWKSFHVDKPIEELTEVEKKKYLSTALKAERWVDNWGKREMKKHFPHLQYIDSYLCKDSGNKFTKQIKKELGL